MTEALLSKIAEHLLNAGNIAILPHVNVDGDALGAAIALGLALSGIHKQVDVLVEEEIPSNLDFLPGLELIKHNPPVKYDVALNIDNGDISRLGTREQYYRNAGVKLSIDHHETNHVDADYSFVDTKASATGEIVYRLILSYLKLDLNSDMAVCLYTALITDTGGFRYTNTTPHTLEIGAELLRFGIDFNYINKKVFDMISHTKLYLIKQTINSLRILENGKLAISYLSYNDIKSHPAKGDDFEGLVNYGRNLEGVEVSAFFREDEKGHFKVSLRSNNYVDVASVSEKFNGGGHKRAAGFNITGELEEAIASLVAVISVEIRGKA
jgi:phosphoesterase RecJ-like protein